MPQAFRRPAAIGNIHMPARQNAAKKGFNLTPKHLLLAAFVVVALAVAALVVGVFRTMSAPVETAAAPPANSSGTVNTVASIAACGPRLGANSIPSNSATLATGDRRMARNSCPKPPGLYSAACQ